MIYVDDGHGCCQSDSKFQEMAVYLNQVFEVTTKGTNCYVGLHICCN
jgi:hypothetical protein